MPLNLSWKMGFEIELISPLGLSRRDLAERVAHGCEGAVRRFFHPQSEPSKVPGQAVFENLTLGFRVDDAAGKWVASFVDDLTLQQDLDRQKPPRDSWYRIVADDARILRLAMRHCDPGAGPDTVLQPLAALFGTAAETHQSGMVRVSDETGASVAICASLPGERERPCEIVTAPLARDHENTLTCMLGDAQALGFTMPAEGASHIHFDGSALCHAPVISRVVRFFDQYGEALRTLVGVNPKCTRLGPWPAELVELVRKPEFLIKPWHDARMELASLKLTKYCDVNIVNLVNASKDKHTLEIRTLPSALDAEPILMAAALFEAVLKRCCEPAIDIAWPETLSGYIAQLPLEAEVASYWHRRLGSDH